MKSVTVGCKISPEEKRQLEKITDNLGMDKSTYIRAKLFQEHEKIQQLSALPNDLVIAPEYVESIYNLMKQLKAKHPNQRTSAILQGALSLTLENEGRYVSNKLKNYL